MHRLHGLYSGSVITSHRSCDDRQLLQLEKYADTLYLLLSALVTCPLYALAATPLPRVGVSIVAVVLDAIGLLALARYTRSLRTVQRRVLWQACAWCSRPGHHERQTRVANARFNDSEIAGARLVWERGK